MKKLILITLFITPLLSEARKPAVEPVSGISIDEYKEVPPSEAQGFNWDNKQDTEANTQKTDLALIKTDTSKLPQREVGSVSGPDLTPAVILLFMLALPFGIWFFLLGKLDKPENEVGFQDEDQEDNTLAFPNRSSKNDDDDDDHNLPKAS